MSGPTALETTFEKETPHDPSIRAQQPEEDWEEEEWEEDEEWDEEDGDAWDDEGWDSVDEEEDDLDELEEFGNDERFSPAYDDEEEW